MRFVAVAVQTGPQLISKLKEGLNVDALKTLSVVTNSLVVPTPMGVPLSLNVSAGAVLKLEGMVKANSLPELSHFVLRRPFMTRKIEIVSDIKPRYSTTLVDVLQSKFSFLTKSQKLLLQTSLETCIGENYRFSANDVICAPPEK